MVSRVLVGPKMLRSGRRYRTFRSTEVQHISVFPKHVDLLHTRDGLDVELLQSAL